MCGGGLRVENGRFITLNVYLKTNTRDIHKYKYNIHLTPRFGLSLTFGTLMLSYIDHQVHVKSCQAHVKSP